MLVCAAAGASAEPVALRYEDFGAVGDGIADDQAALLATHVRANACNAPVRARDGATYRIGGGRAVIPVMTDVDFGTARFVIDDRAVEDARLPVFHVVSRHSPVRVDGVGPVCRGQANLGVTLPARSLVLLSAVGRRQFVRKGANANRGSDQHEWVVAAPNGDVASSAPVVWDYGTNVSVTAYPIDAAELTLKGGTFVTVANANAGPRTVYYVRGICVERSNVRLEGVRHEVEGEGEVGNPYRGFVTILHAADVTMSGCVVCGHRVYRDSVGTPHGSYDISVNESVGVRLRGCVQSNDIDDASRWGVFTSNYSKDLVLEDCRLSRFDAHCGVCNVTICRSTLGHQGVNVTGFGLLRLEDSTVRGGALVNLRKDYGSFWNGDFKIRNCRFVPRRAKAKMPCLFGAQNDGTHDFGYPCMMPRSIEIDGLVIADSPHPNRSVGAYVFADPNPANTNAAYASPYPYAVTERVKLLDVRTESGLPLRISPNPWMFRHLTKGESK